MSNVNSNVAAVQADSTSNKLKPHALHGRVRIAKGFYAGNDAAGTIINLVKLPPTAVILPSSKIRFEAGQGATTTVKVGTSADDDALLAAVAIGASAGSKELSAIPVDGYKLTGETMLIMTTGVAALTADKKIGFEIFYVVD